MTTTATRYAIVRTRYFFGSPNKRDLLDGGSAWPTLAEANAEIRRQESGTYYQSHNEHGRASYRAVRVDRLPQHLR
jgi:hypothetical protein